MFLSGFIGFHLTAWKGTLGKRGFHVFSRNVVNSKLFLESDNLNNRTEILNFPTGMIYLLQYPPVFNDEGDPVKELRDFHYYL